MKALVETERSAPQIVMVRRAEQSFMPKSAERPFTRLPMWRRAVLVATAGVLFGFGVAISFGPVHRPVQTAQRQSQASSDVRSQPAPAITSSQPESLRQAVASNPDTAEIERLKTRNRRLEALVQVWKNRAQQKSQP